MPEITLSLPVALGLMILVLAIGMAIVFAVLRSSGVEIAPTATITPSPSPTVTQTPLPTSTSTPLPTFTPLPDIEYTVAANDTCLSIAYAFKVSPQSIIVLNNLPVACDTLSIGQKLRVPQPTPTASPMPTNTLSPEKATEVACEKVEYEVKAGDTLGGIAAAYRVSMDGIKVWNGLTTESVIAGQTLKIPLCERLPTPGPTPTATLPPPYPAPNLLLPADGTSFTGSDTITLQWAAVGELREGEVYAVTVEDVTDGTGRKVVEYVSDTKFIVPANFRPGGNTPHVIRWWVVTARQSGTTKDGQPIWSPAGAASTPFVFSWTGGGAAPEAVATPTP